MEGAAYEVIQGLGPIIKQLGVIHVELELVSLYKDLHMFKEVNDYLKNNGFVCIGKQLHQGGKVGDFVYINKEFLGHFADLKLGLTKLKSFIGIFYRRFL